MKLEGVLVRKRGKGRTEGEQERESTGGEYDQNTVDTCIKMSQ